MSTEDNTEEELIPVEELPQETGEEEHLEDEDLEEVEERRLGASDEDEETEDEKKERRRVENRERRKRQKEARDRNQVELTFLRNRNEELERRQSAIEARVGQTEMSSIDSRISEIQRNISLADDVMQKSLEQQKGNEFVEAQKIRDGLRDDLAKLTGYKDQLSQTSTKQPESQKQAPVDPILVQHAQKWMQDHPWWNPQAGDEDSLIVSAIDNSLVNEHYDPKSSEYWDELSRRVEERLPHRFKETPSKPRGGPRLSSGKSSSRATKPNEIYISPERRKAMEEAGVWDDPKLRQRYLKQYQAYDREHAS